MWCKLTQNQKNILSNYFSNGETIELYGRLHADLLYPDKMVINGVEMNIETYTRTSMFLSSAPSKDNKVCIKILDVTISSLKSN